MSCRRARSFLSLKSNKESLLVSFFNFVRKFVKGYFDLSLDQLLNRIDQFRVLNFLATLKSYFSQMRECFFSHELTDHLRLQFFIKTDVFESEGSERIWTLSELSYFYRKDFRSVFARRFFLEQSC